MLRNRFLPLLFATAPVLLACERQSAAPPPAAPAEKPPPPPGDPLASRPPPPRSGATVSGHVWVSGPPPAAAATPPAQGSDAFCAGVHLADESLRINKNGTLRDVLVRVVRGGGGPYAPPREPVVFAQQGCMYRPRVQVAMQGQPVQVKNGDPTLHNVHALLGPRTLFNKVQMDAQAPVISFAGSEAGALLKLRCDVHPWMAAYLWISDHPFLAVTGEDGRFTIHNLPPGDYTFEAWHERLGTQAGKLTIAAAPEGGKPDQAPIELDFRFDTRASGEQKP